MRKIYSCCNEQRKKALQVQLTYMLLTIRSCRHVKFIETDNQVDHYGDLIVSLAEYTLNSDMNT